MKCSVCGYESPNDEDFNSMTQSEVICVCCVHFLEVEDEPLVEKEYVEEC